MTPVKNKVQLTGKICVPKITVAESGLKVAELCIYVNEAFYNKEGEKVNELMIHTCKAYGELAEAIADGFSKTSTFAIEGILVTSSYKLRGWTMPFKHIQVSSFSIFRSHSNC